MSAGPKLARRLLLEERVRVPDGAGGFTAAWGGVGILWAEVTARSGREDFVAGRPLPRVAWRIRVRGAPVGSPARPRPDQRFREGARIFTILTVAEADPAGRYLEILAEEGVLP